MRRRRREVWKEVPFGIDFSNITLWIEVVSFGFGGFRVVDTYPFSLKFSG